MVISARQGQTDLLLDELRQLGGQVGLPAADVILACGELRSAAGLALAIETHGSSAALVLPWTIFHTNDKFGDADILRVNIAPVLRVFQQRSIAIVPGFLGAYDGQITTLGRGGSDYSAVMLAAALQADCVLLKGDVDGIYNADPYAYANAVRYDVITYSQAFDLSTTGAKVLNAKAANAARRYGVPLIVRSTYGDGPGTQIVPDPLPPADQG